MKKTYILGMALLAGSMSFAQKAETKLMVSNENTELTRPNHQNRAAGDLIGSIMDFSNPSDWVNDAGNAQDWLIGTTTPNGPFTSNTVAIASTSGGNFALIQGDGFTGTAMLTMAASVDLSAYTNVAIEFESYYRNFTGTCFIDISLDNGTTWNNSYPVHELLPLNENTANPELVSINLTSIAAGQGTVSARFRYESTDDYFWMVDDVKFVEGYEDNLIMEQTFMSMGIQALDYYMIPSSQLSEITFGAFIYNGGINPQALSTMAVLADDNGTNVYTGNSTPGTIAPFTRDSLTIITPNGWTPETDKNYRITYGVGSTGTEQTINDNVDTLYNIVTGGRVFARDNGIATGATEHLGDPNVNVATEMGNIFDAVGDISIGRVQVGLGNNTEVGAELYAKIGKWNGSEYTTVGQSDAYIVQAGEPGTIVEIKLTDLVSFVAGDDFSITAYHDDNNAVSVQSAQIGSGVLLYNDGSLSSANSVFIVRGVEDFLEVDNNSTASTTLNAYPNPANNNVNINFSINESSTVSVSVVSVTGDVVYNNNLGSITAGTYNENINASELANGVYFYTLNVNGNVTTKKLVISKK